MNSYQRLLLSIWIISLSPLTVTKGWRLFYVDSCILWIMKLLMSCNPLHEFWPADAWNKSSTSIFTIFNSFKMRAQIFHVPSYSVLHHHVQYFQPPSLRFFVTIILPVAAPAGITKWKSNILWLRVLAWHLGKTQPTWWTLLTRLPEYIRGKSFKG